MKKRRLRKWVKVALSIVVLSVLLYLINMALNNYNSYLENCDNVKGYTCNIFGK